MKFEFNPVMTNFDCLYSAYLTIDILNDYLNHRRRLDCEKNEKVSYKVYKPVQELAYQKGIVKRFK